MFHKLANAATKAENFPGKCGQKQPERKQKPEKSPVNVSQNKKRFFLYNAVQKMPILRLLAIFSLRTRTENNDIRRNYVIPFTTLYRKCRF